MDFPQLQFDYADPKQCLDLLQSVPLTNLDLARDVLVRVIRGMLATPPAPLAHLEVLEQARPSVSFVTGELARRYAFQPLPPALQEQDLLLQVVSLLQAMAHSYSEVANRGGDLATIQSRLALICQRCIHYSGRAILEHFRARREIPPGLWIDLHGYYATAEEWNIAAVRVVEPLNELHAAESCQDAYSTILLVDLANPYSRLPREFIWVLRWASLFAQETSIVPPTGSAEESKCYGVDLMLDNGLRPLTMLAHSATLHRFDGSKLAPRVQQLILKLREGEKPTDLGLGDDIVMPQGARLLLQLYRPWCHAAATRRYQRRVGGGTAQLSLGLDAIHYHTSGEEFVQPEPTRNYTRAQVDSILTFGERVEGGEKLQLRAAQIGFGLETWDVVNQSVAGFRLRYESAESRMGSRIENNQLVGVFPPDGECMLLGHVSWTMYESSGALMIGIALLPGTPETLAARQVGVNVGSTSNPYSRAFVLPAVAALKEPNSLIVPRGWYQKDRVLELYIDHPVRARLGALLFQGVDFERVAYVVV